MAEFKGGKCREKYNVGPVWGLLSACERGEKLEKMAELMP